MRLIHCFFFAFVTMSMFGLSSASNNDVYEAIASNEELKKLSETCPADLVQNEDIAFENLTSVCEGNASKCLKKCLKGSSNHCFGLANQFNINDENSGPYARPLYAKSCQLGLASSCTNVGANLKTEFGLESASCYTKTFERTCALEDPWGCTMYGVSLIYGEGVEKNLDKALSAMRGSCRFGKDDPACSGALQLAGEIIIGEFD